MSKLYQRREVESRLLQLGQVGASKSKAVIERKLQRQPEDAHLFSRGRVLLSDLVRHLMCLAESYQRSAVLAWAPRAAINSWSPAFRFRITSIALITPIRIPTSSTTKTRC